ncbi:5' nucleotidase, NT5C type [Thomasclavelia cocleata]|uniref:5' nucleotidase, NT5C type n=1 Tax=Thomasclavelia cocleata TaxID=69824 RepID=UPI00272DCFFC|nr:hypothetical protein [Thomasclavelia cocleata]
MKKIRVFVGLEGTLAKFKKIKKIEDIFMDDYFKYICPYESMIEALKELVKEMDVYIISSVLNEGSKDKINKWLDSQIPEIPIEKRIYINYGKSKNTVCHSTYDFLIDNSSNTLSEWKKIGNVIKTVNEDCSEQWDGYKIYCNSDPLQIVASIKAIILETILVYYPI